MSPSRHASTRHHRAVLLFLVSLLFGAPLSAQDESTRTLLTADRLIDGFEIGRAHV